MTSEPSFNVFELQNFSMHFELFFVSFFLFDENHHVNKFVIKKILESMKSRRTLEPKWMVFSQSGRSYEPAIDDSGRSVEHK